jgi:hypothetical protein
MRKALASGIATAAALMTTVFTGGPASADTTNVELFAIVGPPSGQAMCMDVFGGLTANGTGVRTWQCNGTAAQRWNVIESGSTIRNQGKCLHARNGGTANGTPLELWTCNGTGAEVFIPDAGFPNGMSSTFYNPQSNKCVDVPGNAYPESVNLVLWDCNGTRAQYWWPAVV